MEEDLSLALLCGNLLGNNSTKPLGGRSPAFRDGGHLSALCLHGQK